SRRRAQPCRRRRHHVLQPGRDAAPDAADAGRPRVLPLQHGGPRRARRGARAGQGAGQGPRRQLRKQRPPGEGIPGASSGQEGVNPERTLLRTDYPRLGGGGQLGLLGSQLEPPSGVPASEPPGAPASGVPPSDPPPVPPSEPEPPWDSPESGEPPSAWQGNTSSASVFTRMTGRRIHSGSEPPVW